MRHILPALIAAAPLLAQAPIPTTPAGQKLKAWLDNFNVGDAARTTKFAQENYAPEFLQHVSAEQCAQMDTGARGQRGELTIHSVEPQDAHKLKALLTNKDQSAWLELTLGVTPEAPHLVAWLGIRPAQKPAKADTQPKAAAGSALPNTIAGKKFKTWFENYNSGDAKRCAQFFRENSSPKTLERHPAEQVGEKDAGLRTRFGELSVYSADSLSEHEIKVLVTNKDQTKWFEFGFMLGAESPNFFRGISIRQTERPGLQKSERLPDAALAQDLDKYLQTRTAEDTFAGAILIAKDGKPIFSKAYGLADRDKRIPNTLDTKFNLGSMNKMLTAVAIAQLAQAGTLQFTDTIAKLLPDYPNKEVAVKVTVHQLLTHTSGLGDIFGEEFGKKKDSLRTVKDYFQFFVDKPLSFEPGAQHGYSNAGFVVLGAIIEKLSGQDYYTYIRKHITQPLGMKDSESYAKNEVVPKMAIPYTQGEKADDPKRDSSSLHPFRGFPAGGGYSTVGDLLKFAEGLRGYKLLNQEFTERIIGKKINMPGLSKGYAYGFEDSSQDGIRTVGHGGGAQGVNGKLSIYWDSGYTVVVLANLDPPAASVIENYIRERIQAK